MYSTYMLYNIVPLGFLMLLVFIFMDIFLDYFRTEKKSNKNWIILYSFIFYFICLIQIKFGGFTLPQNPADESKRFISTNDWFGIFETMNYYTSIWRISALFYNVILFVPLGIFLVLLFQLASTKKVGALVIFICLGIEFTRLLFGWTGLVMRGFGQVDIIFGLLNILGGLLGLLIAKFVWNTNQSSIYTDGAI